MCGWLVLVLKFDARLYLKGISPQKGTRATKTFSLLWVLCFFVAKSLSSQIGKTAVNTMVRHSVHNSLVLSP